VRCWGEGEDATLRSKPSSPRFTNDAKDVGPMRTSRAPFALLHCETKARLRRCLLASHPHRVRKPSGIRPTVTGPAGKSVLRASSVIAFSVMTVCNLPLGEYSGDTVGSRGHKRPCLRAVGTRAPINTLVQYP
jgi:hypothetical protein